ncbi:ectoine hydroxylase [Spongiibacter taiwanensis]|uniref:ectoine hydroxylase n=1 Tax=Spongiibacter taiwanensis TaxID=1748242 RepID=UPI002035BB52|nr:ectoine hydroxylase [Spongiibacter taiwanensis]USA42175.1 ectoine hydroxylase [Spongiibacter taiwanensis]
MYLEASLRYRDHSLNLGPQATDPYPTRLAASPTNTMLPRLEPPAEEATDDGPLNAQQVANFARDGFLYEPDFLNDADVASLQRELRGLLESSEFHQADYAVTEPDSDAIRSLFAVHFLSDVFGRLAQSPALLARVEQLLGGQTYVHQSRINYKPGFAGKGFNWHSDFETWHAEDGMPGMRAVSASIILTENHTFNGPLMLIPGSHQQFLPCVGPTPEDNYKQSLKSQRIGTPPEAVLTELVRRRGIQAPTGRAGGLILFDCNTLHGSNANMSPDPRSNIFFVYNRRDNACVQPFAASRPRPEFLAHRADGSWSGH